MRFDQDVLLSNLFVISFITHMLLSLVYEREISKYWRIYKQPPVIQIGNSRTCTTKQSCMYTCIRIYIKHIGIYVKPELDKHESRRLLQ